MKRVSSNMAHLDNLYQMMNRDQHLSRVQKGISSSRGIGNLRDNPVAAAQSTRLDSAGKRLNRYLDNADTARSRWNQAEGYMSEAVSIVQRLRELTLQGAHGTYSSYDLSLMAGEVDEMVKELVLVGNARGGDGQYLFAGDDVNAAPFITDSGRVAGREGESITQVRYAGDIGRNPTEITDGNYIEVNMRGNEVFWAEEQQVFGARDTEGFVVREAASFNIDGKRVNLEAGDNIQTVVRKINDSGAAVKASLDPVTGSLNLRTTIPHQIWLEEVEGTPLQDLALLSDVGGRPPSHWHPDAVVSGGSLFDQAIALRDALLGGDQKALGGAVIAGIDHGLDSLLRNLSDLGSRTERLVMTASRLDHEIGAVEDWKSILQDLDITSAVTELKMLEHTQKAAYQAASRILLPTLMDFLR